MKKKRDISMTGAVGALLQSDSIKEINPLPSDKLVKYQEQAPAKHSKVFQSRDGLTFSSDELVLVPWYETECWEYANRTQNEMGPIEELAKSIKEQGQLQPALIAPHPKPHGQVKYIVYFGRRRREACKFLDRDLLAIYKETSLSISEALRNQRAENKERLNVSPYADSLILKRILDDGIYKTQIELAASLGETTASLSELLSFTKIPDEITNLIPDMSKVSVRMALMMVKHIKENKGDTSLLHRIAHKIGITITSKEKLLAALAKHPNKLKEQVKIPLQNGQTFCTISKDDGLIRSVNFSKKFAGNVDIEKLTKILQEVFID